MSISTNAFAGDAPASDALRLAIRFEPDGYALDGPRLMGRQSAGNGFLRAALAAAAGGELLCCTPSAASYEAFKRMLPEPERAPRTAWIPALAGPSIADVGTLYTPDAGIARPAGLRLPHGIDSWSIVGVTHTTASEGAMAMTTNLLTAPVMPWDALICTSHSVRETLKSVLGEAAAMLAWRTGAGRIWLPSLPIIPLGVHCDDFDFSDAEREEARRTLGIAPDETVALFVGRLSFHAKAHPFPMYLGLERAARATGRKLVLVQCGWFANDAIERAFKDGAERFCPSVRRLFADGRKAEARRAAWAAGDFFVSLSDNIQETFGLVPIEAMAAGLPVVVSDWDGYRELVRHEIDGFRIPTSAPDAGFGEETARIFEAGRIDYDAYCALTSQTTAMDHDALAQSVARLLRDPELRRRMGEAGRTRARAVYDWTRIMGAYRALFSELATIRARAKNDPAIRTLVERAPRSSPAWPDPFRAFAHYPTRRITPETRVTAGPGRNGLSEVMASPLFTPGSSAARATRLAALAAATDEAPVDVAELARLTGIPLRETLLGVASLAKMDAVRIADGFEIPPAEV
jgi:starch synthase